MKKRTLLIALFLLAVSGLVLHYRIHYFMIDDKSRPGNFIFDSTRFLATLFPLVDLVLVTALFMSQKTAVYGYLLNGLIVIYGSIFMTHFSVSEMIAKPISLHSMLLKSTLPDVGIAWVDFFVGKRPL